MLRLGDRRRGGHRGGVREGRCGREAGNRLSACIPRRWKPAARWRIWIPSPASSRCGRRPGAARAPHALRALVAGLPEHKIRVISPDIGGGFGNKVPIYPGYVCAIVGSLLLGKPVKWMEDRSETSTSTGFARDYIMVGEIAATKDGKILAIRPTCWPTTAFNGTAAPVKYPAGSSRLHRQLRHRGRLLPHDRGVHQQGARRCGIRVLVPDHRSGVLR